MKAFSAPYEELAEFARLRELLSKGPGIIDVNGCADPQKSHMMYGIGDGFKCKIIATFSEQKAREIVEDYSFYDPNVLYFPAKDLIFFQADMAGNAITLERMKVLKALLEKEDITVVTTPNAFLAAMPLPSVLSDSVIMLSEGDELSESDLSAALVAAGYVRNYQVEGAGQFSIRGGIIDIFPLTEDNPVRIELWGDTIDSIRSFDILSQRSIQKLSEILIYPASEMVLSTDEFESGIERIERDCKKQEKILRDQFLTKEAHELSVTVDSFIEEARLLGAGSVNTESYLSYFYEETGTLFDYLSKDSTVFFMDEPNRCNEMLVTISEEFVQSMEHRLSKGYALPGQMNMIGTPQQLFGRLSGMRCVTFETLFSTHGFYTPTEALAVSGTAMNSYNNSFEGLVEDLRRYQKNGYRVIVLSASSAKASRLAEDLAEHDLTVFFTRDEERIIKPGEIMVTCGRLRQGFSYPLVKFAVIAEGDIFSRRERKKRFHKQFEGTKISGLTELSVGDYVVHESYGLGIYCGIEHVMVDHVTKDYMKLQYAADGRLYVPATGLDLIQKYASKDATAPKLSKLGTTEWVRTKSKVKEAVDIIASDLVDLYATRQAKEGYVFGEDTVWQTEFEELFPFEETSDQVDAIRAVKEDMQSTKIMDRLICGDVGYGKTEIAIRAAFKAVQEGKQVVYLVPTTILAQQHYNTFLQRMKDYPVRIDLLCRFRTAAQQKKTIADLKNGMVDIVIGTHRVLSNDVSFKNLGLLVIDEEQRFGVAHKEKIKKLRDNVDVLTLTATPIPRTLHMSLIGIRDMSVLQEAPQDRLPIQTFVMEYNEELVREAIERELSRGGQVFYVYNRVQSIAEMTSQLRALVPNAEIAYAHGQMKEQELERIMYDFVSGSIDVLVSTTIIETGLDIPNVNTMIVHDADRLGLSQLYQLRGRIGRSSRGAYAFLMYRRNKILKEEAEKRLAAIRDFTELGSGFKIAMRDLEIRGAGNLLGNRQSGHMEAVGYDLYCKLLSEAVKRQKGEKPEEDVDVSVDLTIDAYIPDTFILNEAQKIDIYKRIACISDKDEQSDMRDELTDRFGSIPKSVENLLQVAYMRSIAKKVYVTDVKDLPENREIRFTVLPNARYNPESIGTFVASFGGAMRLLPGAKPCFLYKIPKDKPAEGDALLEMCMDIVDRMLSLL